MGECESSETLYLSANKQPSDSRVYKYLEDSLNTNTPNVCVWGY